MTAIQKLKRMLRGKVNARTVALETVRRARAAQARRRERSRLAQLNVEPARLLKQFSEMLPADLLKHFQSRSQPAFFPGIIDGPATAQKQKLEWPDLAEELIDTAQTITVQHSWSLLGLDNRGFGAEEVQWQVDPSSFKPWPRSYHADINLIRRDGSDVRLVWELNRLGHFNTLGRAYALTGNDQFSAAFFNQLAGWRAQNPVAIGVNWACAMEVALRSINLLAAFVFFLRAPQMSPENLSQLLTMFDQHGAHIERNLEYSHIATSNHYLSDVVGLFWLGLMLPELEAASRWREFGWREILQEMDKQILPDGAHYECSTGYHRFVLELFLYSFLLARLNGIDVPEKYWSKLRSMLEYVRAYLRPDGRAPLIGDSDGGQVMPIVQRLANDHAYVLALGAAVFKEPNFKLPEPTFESIETLHRELGRPLELDWLLGDAGVKDYEALPYGALPGSSEFRDVGTVVLREDDNYLLLNASGVGMHGRGSHRHNDVLSIEVSAGGTAFIVDPGTYLYTGDLPQRHLFRSTAYHSTVQVGEREQRPINEGDPFAIGNVGQILLLRLNRSPVGAVATAYFFYGGPEPRPNQRRIVGFYPQHRYWLVHDQMQRFSGREALSYRFHLGPDVVPEIKSEGLVKLYSSATGAGLLIVAENLKVVPFLEERFSSNDYGVKKRSYSICWKTAFDLDGMFLLIPVASNENAEERLETIRALGR